MRLSAWRAAAPRRDAASAKLSAIVDDVLLAFGAGRDPHCWVAWGEEPAIRHSILVPTEPGLVQCFVRVNVSGEGPRTTTKLIRWNRVSVGELAMETQAGHRLLSFQVEGQVLRGVDAEADRVAAFGLRLIAAIDGRPLPPVSEERSPRRSRAASTTSKAAAAAKLTRRAGAEPKRLTATVSSGAAGASSTRRVSKNTVGRSAPAATSPTAKPSTAAAARRPASGR